MALRPNLPGNPSLILCMEYGKENTYAWRGFGATFQPRYNH